MRLFKLLISFAVFFLLCGSLSAQLKKNGYVQVLEVKSDLPDAKNKFTFENDTLRLTYYFWAEKGMIQIGITNKLDDTLYIDWGKSFFQNGDDKLSYAPETDLNAENQALYQEYIFNARGLKTVDYVTMNSAVGKSDAAHRAESITAIKPHSYYMRAKFHLTRGEFYRFATSVKAKSVARSTDVNAKANIYEQEFTKDDSKMKFSSFLTYSAKKDFKTPSVVKHNFYVSKITEMDVRHFWGVKEGKDADGNPVYKMPTKKSTAFYVSVDKKNAVEYRAARGLE